MNRAFFCAYCYFDWNYGLIIDFSHKVCYNVVSLNFKVCLR